MNNRQQLNRCMHKRADGEMHYAHGQRCSNPRATRNSMLPLWHFCWASFIFHCVVEFLWLTCDLADLRSTRRHTHTKNGIYVKSKKLCNLRRCMGLRNCCFKQFLVPAKLDCSYNKLLSTTESGFRSSQNGRKPCQK